MHTCESGGCAKKGFFDHAYFSKNVVLVDQQLTIQFLSQTQAGSMHDKRIADATPYPLPPGSHLLQDLGFLAFTLEGVVIDMPTKKPRGGELTTLEKEANRAWHDVGWPSNMSIVVSNAAASLKMSVGSCRQEHAIR